MWSHTIPSSRPVKAPAAKDKPAKVHTTTKFSTDAPQEEGMPQGFEADGFSKTSRIRASKKPLTVAKAPTLGRTTSRRDDEPATPTDSLRPGLVTRASRVPPTIAAKEGGNSQRAQQTGTPTRPPSAAAKAKAPALSLKTKTPAQAPASPIVRTTAHGRPVARGSKTNGVPSGRAERDKLSPKARKSNPSADGDRMDDSSGNRPHELAADEEDDVSFNQGVNGNPHDHNLEDVDDGEHRSSEQVPEATHEKSEEVQQEQPGGPENEAHETLNREIALRNQTIKSLRDDLQTLRTSQEHKSESKDSAAAAKIESLQSDLDSVRSRLADLNDTHRSTLEKHDSLIRSRDKIIQNLSSETHDLREELEGRSEAEEQITQTPQQKSQIVLQGQRLDDHINSSQSKDEEIQSLSEIVQDLRKQLEAADTARAKEIYDELLRSKDEKIDSVSGVVQDLRGELKAVKPAGKPKLDNQLIRLKDEETRSLSKTVESLQEKLEAIDKAKEQEVSHSVMSLRDEFRELQNKHKRKIEESEAAAAKRAEALQSNHDELLRSRDQEIKDMASMTQDLQKEIETARESQKREFENTMNNCEQRLHESRTKQDEVLVAINTKHARELEDIKAEHQVKDLKHQSSLHELSRKHRIELESVRTAQQAADTSHQQEIRDKRRMHEQVLESVKLEAQNECRDEIARLTRGLEDAMLKHQQGIDELGRKHRDEMAMNAKTHDQAFEDAASKHQHELQEASEDYERKLKAADTNSSIAIEEAAQRHRLELEEANIKHQQDLADVERLRGQGSEDVSQKYEDQLKTIAAKYQQELGEAATRLDETSTRHEQELQQVRTNLDQINKQAEAYQHGLEQIRGQHDVLKNQNRSHVHSLQAWATKHEEEMEIVSTKYQKTMVQANAKMDQLMEAIARQKLEHHDKISELQRETEQRRDESAVAAAETASLKVATEEMKLSQSETDEVVNRVHQQELHQMASKHGQELSQLHTEIEAAAAEIGALKKTLEESEIRRSEALNDAERSHEQSLWKATLAHEKITAQLRQERDLVTSEMGTLKQNLQQLDQAGGDAAEKITSLADTLKDKELAQGEADIEIALLKDKLELSDREKARLGDTVQTLQQEIEDLQARIAITATENDRDRKEAAVELTLLFDKKDLAERRNHQYNDTIVTLRQDLDRIQAQLADASADLDRERNENVVEIALLKDKLELAELQKRSASEDISLSRNESNVEIALLKDKLELADLQSQQDKRAITALEDELQSHNTKIPNTDPYIHYQLREELAMLSRHHAANLADVAALKASILAEREVREEEWKNRAEGRERIAKEMQGIRAELNGITGVH